MRENVRITVFDRTYELLEICQKGETSISGDTMLERANKMNVDPGSKEGIYILIHSVEIPRELKYKVSFVFPGWKDPNDSNLVLYVFTDGHQWHLNHHHISGPWGDDLRFLRRIA